MKTVAVVAEHEGGRAKPVTDDLVAFARVLGRYEGAVIKVIVVGDDISPTAGHIAAATGLDVVALNCPDARDYNSEIYIRALTGLFKDMAPSYISLPHSSRGLDFGPALAVKLKAGCISGVEDVFPLGDGIGFSRSVYGGKFVSRVRPVSDCTVLTVQPGFFKAETGKSAGRGKVAVRSFDGKASAVKALGTRAGQSAPEALTAARVVVAAGRGIGEKEHLALIRQLAALFPKSAVAGSRIVCDLGWLDHRRQVGVTGATVSPELYIACGISGALQHVMAMRGSAFVVSINTDPHAAIFNESDICIVEDLKEFIPLLIAAWEDGAGRS